MKTGLRLPLISFFLTVVGSGMWGSLDLFAQGTQEAQALTAEQLAKIQQELEKIRTDLDGKRLSSRSSAITAFQRAASSEKATLEFYLACYKEVNFKDARLSDFRSWRERNDDKLKDRGTLSIYRIQLQYLILTLRAAENVPMKTLVPEVESFAAHLAASTGLLGDLKLLRQSVDNTVFAEAYGLDKSLKPPAWSMQPGNIASIYEKTVLPYFRENEPASLQAAWDRRIKLEADYLSAASSQNSSAIETFKIETLPRLQFERACDLFKYTSQQQGAFAIITLLKGLPSHPKASDWLHEFEELLNQSTKPPGSAPTTPTAVSPPQTSP